jgi:hypothetical protein
MREILSDTLDSTSHRTHYRWIGDTMSFFEMPPEDEAAHREPEPRRRRWIGDDSDTVGVPVPLALLLAQTEEVAVVASGFSSIQQDSRLA